MRARIVIATRNPGKAAELTRLLALPAVELVALDAIEPPMPDVVEDAGSFEGNAIKKAREAARHAGAIALGDDSGLEVDALDGAPGIHSARYSGLGTRANIDKLLRALEAVDDAKRTARFRCVLAIVDARGADSPLVVSGTCEGRIAHSPRGHHGFGYDPLFVPVGSEATIAELDDDAKDAISHRGVACRALASRLEAWLLARA